MSGWIALNKRPGAGTPVEAAGGGTSPSAAEPNGWCGGLLSLGCDCPWVECGFGYATVRTTRCCHPERCYLGGSRHRDEAELDYAEMLA